MDGKPSNRLLAALVSAVVVTGCAGGSGGASEETESAPVEGAAIDVVATTSILGDLARHVVGDTGSVEVIIDAGTDPHAFEASASDIAAVREADLVVANGLDLESSLLDALEAAEGEGVEVLHVAESVDPLPFDPPGHDGGEGGDDHGDDHGGLDPHFWLDPRRAATAVDVIADAVTEEAPAVAGTVASNAEAYREEILALDAELEEMFRVIPDGHRTLVTNHDAFGYLAARYGFDVVGTVVPGGSTLAEPSARELAELAATIDEAGVPAIFTENIAPDRVIETVSREVGRQIEVVTLYSDALGDEGSGADTYLGLMRTNAQLIVDALGS